MRRYFGVSCSTDGGQTFVRAYPVDLSVDGVGLISVDEIRTRTMIVSLELDGIRIQAAAQCVSVKKGTLRGNVVWRVGARFLRLAREDRAVIDRFVQRLPLNVPPTPAPGELPESVVRKILQQLVQLKRLAPQRLDRQPLVKMQYGGIIQRGNWTLHSIRIESRIVHDNRATIYATQAYVNDRFTRIEVIPLDNGHAESILPASRREALKQRSA